MQRRSNYLCNLRRPTSMYRKIVETLKQVVKKNAGRLLYLHHLTQKKTNCQKEKMMSMMSEGGKIK